MGKFDGVLIASDFDNTMVYTEGALRSGGPVPAISRENRDAIEYFMAQGGTFSVATGRALPSFASVMDGVPMNGPTVLFNGAAIYDFPQKKYLVTAFLPDSVRQHVTEVVTALPQVAVELYHDDNTIHALNANDVTRRHMHITHEVDTMDDVPSPISKALFSTEEAHLPALLDFLASRPWYHDYEVVPSAVTLVELTAKGANKGGMVRRLADLLDVARENVICVGDHANDISMLTWAGQGYAPANAIPQVLHTPGVRRLPDCRDNAIAQLIRSLDKQL